ncbi:MAG: PHP domain-containing protein, partial [Lachnospiraceae bacterium]|nr:PHP domain-containing protein [Lachnospiraceae bacterium]
LKEVTIDRITTNKNHDAIRIYMSCPKLIRKSRIYRLEDEIGRLLYPGKRTKGHIVETFLLPEGQFTPESLFSEYSDSIWEEVNHNNKMLFHILKNADFSFDGDDITIVLEDNTVARKSEGEIRELISGIFTDRCGLNINIKVEYKPRIENHYHTDAEKKIENRLREIENNLNRAKLLEEAAAANDDGEGEKNGSKGKDGSKGKADNGGASGDKGGFNRDGKDKWGNKEAGAKRPLSLVRSSKPNVIYGRDFYDKPIPIADTENPIGLCTIMGEVLSVEVTPIKNEREIVTFVMTDDTDSIKVKIFLTNDQSKVFQSTLSKGMFVTVKGEVTSDSFEHEIIMSSVKGIMTISDFRHHREDKAEEKRVELHAHTKMSDMDAVADVGKLISTAKRWGHKAVAITDHAVVQSFPDADHALKKDDNIKIIYGMEAYMVDDTKPIAINEAGQTLSDSFVVFDIETTGLNCRKCKIIEIGAVRYQNGKMTDRFSEFVNPLQKISPYTTELTSITDADVKDADTIETVLPRFMEFCGNDVLVAHNADFDTGCMIANALKLGIDWRFTHIDTVPLSKFLFPELAKHNLDAVAKRCNVVNAHHHRAIDDAVATAEIFSYMVGELLGRGINTLKDLNEKGRFTDENIMKEAHQAHVTLIAKNDMGRINLYHLVSRSHLDYLTHSAPKKPVLPKSLIEKYREGLIIGSACDEGQIYQTMLLGKADQEIERVAGFYDFYEVQPVANNAGYIGGDKYEIESEEDLRDINRRIVALGEKHKKMVVATGDVHMIEPEDRIYRQIILKQRKRLDGEKDSLCYFRTTDEMLEEFSYLGHDKAYEIVVKNSNEIADMCERIHPTRPDKCPPVIENSDETLRKICYNKVHEIYGENVPEVVSARLERELNSIISNGY